MTVQQMIDLIGLERALEVSRRFGGRRIYISAAPNPPARGAAGALDADIWRALQREQPGEAVEIPSHSAIQHAGRRARAGEMLRDGASVHQVAEETGLSRRTVRRIMLEWLKV